MKRFFQPWPLLIALVAVSCGDGNKKDADASALGAATRHYGCCDASAGVALSSNLFLVANDEDNLLRVYRRDQSGPPVQSFPTGDFLQVDARQPESDIEGAAQVGDKTYWITSHGRNRQGEPRESRQRFFATTARALPDGRVQLQLEGRPYSRLLNDLITDARLAPFRLGSAALLAPKQPGGLNIEGLCPAPGGGLLIGFRNPIPGGRALLVPLLNPEDLIAGRPARFGEPVLLDLGGRGVRDLALSGDRVLIIGGSFEGGGKFHLYSWAGGTNGAQKIPEAKFKGANPEALFTYPGAPPGGFQILSDDGTRQIEGEDCKLIGDPTRKWFRSFWLQLD